MGRWETEQETLNLKYATEHAWRKRNPKRIYATAKVRLARRVGPLPHPKIDVAQMLLLQYGCCAICGKQITYIPRSHTPGGNLDHNHHTRKIRGVLCNYCNSRLPFVEDTYLLNNALDYLSSYV